MRLLFLCRVRGNGLDLGFLDSLALFEVFDGEFQLFNQLLAAFRRLPELLAPQLGQHQLQALDFEPPNLGLALREHQCFSLREDHRVRTGQILRERIRRCRHSTIGAYLQLKIMLKQSSSI